MAKQAAKKKGKGGKILITVIILLILVVALGIVAIFATGGDIDKLSEKIPVKKEIINPLTGEKMDEELPARPLQVSIDNVGDAVPQSWLSKADLVYEFPVEGKQTRLQAIYYSEFPEEFGPIRSTRPYFVDLTREYKAVFLAHGWSPQAKEYLMSGVVPYINAMNSDCDFYRVDDKSAPHNSYIKWSEVKAKIDEQGWWNEKQEIEPFGFLEEGQVNEGAAATEISFEYAASVFEFTYDPATGKYTKTLDGAEYVDHETGETITTSNILVQEVTSSVLDEKGRLQIDMCAGGDAILFTGGVAVKGTWSRTDLDSRTIFIDEAGTEFKLTPGNSWVEVIDQNCELTYL